MDQGLVEMLPTATVTWSLSPLAAPAQGAFRKVAAEADACAKSLTLTLRGRLQSQSCDAAECVHLMRALGEPVENLQVCSFTGGRGWGRGRTRLRFCQQHQLSAARARDAACHAADFVQKWSLRCPLSAQKAKGIRFRCLWEREIWVGVRLKVGSLDQQLHDGLRAEYL